MAKIIIKNFSFTNFLHCTYNWGAAVVVLGALFKLTHLPYADILLYIGMGTEVLVFLIAGFDKPYKTKGMYEIYFLLDTFLKEYEKNTSVYMSAIQNGLHTHDNSHEPGQGYYFNPLDKTTEAVNTLADNKEIEEIIKTVTTINSTYKLELDELLETLEKTKTVNRETQKLADTLGTLNMIYRKVAEAMKA